MTEDEIKEQIQSKEAEMSALKTSFDALNEQIKSATSPYAKDTLRSEWTNQQLEYVRIVKEIEQLKSQLAIKPQLAKGE